MIQKDKIYNKKTINMLILIQLKNYVIISIIKNQEKSKTEPHRKSVAFQRNSGAFFHFHFTKHVFGPKVASTIHTHTHTHHPRIKRIKSMLSLDFGPNCDAGRTRREQPTRAPSKKTLEPALASPPRPAFQPLGSEFKGNSKKSFFSDRYVRKRFRNFPP